MVATGPIPTTVRPADRVARQPLCGAWTPHHTTLGRRCWRAPPNSLRRAPDRARGARMWVGFWAAAFPDSDFIVRFIDPLTYLTTHRGITHSVAMLPLWALVLAVAFMYARSCERNIRGARSWA